MSFFTCYNYNAWLSLAWWMYILVQSGLSYRCNLYVGVFCILRLILPHISQHKNVSATYIGIEAKWLPFLSDFYQTRNVSQRKVSQKSLQQEPLYVLIFYKSHTTHCFIIVFFTWRVVSALNVVHHRAILQGQENIQKLCVHRVLCDLKF